MEVFRMLRDEFGCFGPQRRNRFWGVVKVDREAIGLIMIMHESEYIVIDIAEEVNFGFNSPVVLGVGQSWVFVKETAVPAAHLVV